MAEPLAFGSTRIFVAPEHECGREDVAACWSVGRSGLYVRSFTAVQLRPTRAWASQPSYGLSIAYFVGA
jgi:hypothetical protein